MYKEISININNLIFKYYDEDKIVKVYMFEPHVAFYLGDIKYEMFLEILNRFNTFKSKNLNKISITGMMSKKSSIYSDFKFTIKRKNNLSTTPIKFKIYKKYSYTNGKEWVKMGSIEFKNFSEFDDFVENLALLTKLK